MLDPKNPGQQEHRVLGGPIPVDLASEGSAVWHTDAWAPAIIKSDSTKHGQLLDWGEKPFDGQCAGIAHDGKNFWALDAKNKRICVIERTSGGTSSGRDDERTTVASTAAAMAKKESIVTTVPDYSTLKLNGDMQTQNSFALTIQAAAKLLGKEADYQDIYAWSTAPFAPCFQPEEPMK